MVLYGQALGDILLTRDIPTDAPVCLTRPVIVWTTECVCFCGKVGVGLLCVCKHDGE